MCNAVSLFSSVKTACEPRGTELQEMLTLADTAATSIERLVLDGKIPEVSCFERCCVVLKVNSRYSRFVILIHTR